jgi:hypothetical protein
MSDIPLGYYILYRQQFGDGSSQAARVGPFFAEDAARGALNEFLASGDLNKTDFQLVLRQEIVLGQSG